MSGPSPTETPETAERNRAQKGRGIAATPGAVQQVTEDVFLVKSQSGPGAYRVSRERGLVECNCPDFIKRGLPCKHTASVRFYLEKQTTTPSGEVVSDRVPITYPQAWAAYDQAQKEEIRLFDIFLRDLLADVPEPERDLTRAGRPPIPLRDQLFCSVQKVYSQMSCRRAWGLFENAVERGQLPKAPHYGISSDLFNREDVGIILSELITKSALPLAGLEHGFAPDSTGIRTTSFGAWREEKHGEKRRHVWLKAHALVGVKTHVIVRMIVTEKDRADTTQFATLVREAAERGFVLKEVYADKAYTGRPNYALAEELNMALYAPFHSTDSSRPTQRRATSGAPKVTSKLWTKAFYFFQLHREEFDAKYHARSNVESVFSALKRKFGETLMSRNLVAQQNELLAKALGYNLTVLIHEFFEHGIAPDFLREVGSRGGPAGTL
jgi:transposase